ncbi:MAG: acetylglutamate kinase [Trueperaceae bacterium]|nr:acetylglutamate kinase [Trueperaceae bacterium]
MGIVIKYGGNAMTDLATRRLMAQRIRALAAESEPPVLVHGGGPFIQAALDAAGLEHRFVRGLRVTSPESLEVIERELTVLGKRLAHEIGPAVALTGRDAGLLVAEVASAELGRVGHMHSVEPQVLLTLRSAGLVPVVACLAADPDGGLLNVNADEVAGAVAAALDEGALFLTNVPGVLDDPADPGSLLRSLSAAEAKERISDGRISGGMIPKVEAALSALEVGAPFAVIADGRDPAGVDEALAGGGTRLHM